MVRYKTETRPGLVALYDIRPGNGAGQFLQPQSPHGAVSDTSRLEGRKSLQAQHRHFSLARTATAHIQRS